MPVSATTHETATSVSPGLRTIVAGSRDGVTLDDVRHAIDSCGWRIAVLLSGTARGTDRHGEAIAKERGIPIERHPAAWGAYPNHRKDAGRRRNERMASVSSALVAVWDGRSPGTRHMIETARARGLRVHVHLTAAARALELLPKGTVANCIGLRDAACRQALTPAASREAG